MVYTSTGGGGNSSGTNCAVYAWSDFYSYMVGDNFYGEIDTYCSLTNETLWAGWDIVNVDSNSTVDTGSLSWTTTQWHETQYLNTTSLVNVSAGNYSFDVELKWWNTSSSAWETLDSDSDPFVVYTSTGGGGNSSGTNCAVYAWSDFYSYMVGDNFYGEIDTYCSLTNETLWQPHQRDAVGRLGHRQRGQQQHGGHGFAVVDHHAVARDSVPEHHFVGERVRRELLVRC